MPQVALCLYGTAFEAAKSFQETQVNLLFCKNKKAPKRPRNVKFRGFLTLMGLKSGSGCYGFVAEIKIDSQKLGKRRHGVRRHQYDPQHK